MRLYLNFWVFLSLFLTTAAVSNAEVFKYTDEHGAISFTDDLGKVPEAQRPQATEPVSPSGSLGRLFTDAAPQKWIDHPLSKYIIIFIVLAIVTLVVQMRTKSLLLRLTLKLFFIICIGAAVYSVLVLQKHVPSFQKATESYLPNVSEIEKTKKAIQEMEESQKKQEALINSILNPEKKK
jgi:hypothetical protein